MCQIKYKNVVIIEPYYGSILERKIRRMANFLNDPHLRQMANDEFDTQEPIDYRSDDEVQEILNDFIDARAK